MGSVGCAAVPDAQPRPSPPTPGAGAADRRTDLLATGALVWTAALFGTSFVIVKDGFEHVEPIPYLSFRFLLAGAAFFALAAGRGRPTPAEWRLGVAAGASYAVGNGLQATGLQWIDPATSAFLTYLIVVIVPVYVFVTKGRKPGPTTLVAIVVAVAGLALLTGGGVGLSTGALLTVGGAMAFAVHLVQVGDAAEARFDLLRFNAVQATMTGALLLPLVPFTGGPPTAAEGWWLIVYTALVVTVGTFVPWMWAQRRVNPTRAALILLLEPVFAAIAAYATGSPLSPTSLVGAVLILVAAVLAEVPALRARPSPAT